MSFTQQLSITIAQCKLNPIISVKRNRYFAYWALKNVMFLSFLGLMLPTNFSLKDRPPNKLDLKIIFKGGIRPFADEMLD